MSENMIRDFVFLYLGEWLLIQVGMWACFRERPRHLWIGLLGGLCGFVCVLSDMEWYNSKTIIGIIVVTVVFLCSGSKPWRRLAREGVVVSVCWSVHQILLWFGTIYKKTTESAIYETEMQILERYITCVVVLILIGVYLNDRQKSGFVSSVFFLVIIYGVFYVYFSYGATKYVYDVIEDVEIRWWCIRFAAIGWVYLGVLLAILLILFQVNRRRELLEEQRERYWKAQQDYYEVLLGQDRDIRRFRHDIKKHLLALKGMAGEGEKKRIEECDIGV